MPPSIPPRQPAPKAAKQHVEDLASFVTAAPSSYHAAAEVSRRARAAGFESLDESAEWHVVRGGRYVVVRDGSVIAFAVPADAGPTTPFTILGAHTDSPGFKLKPKPTTGAHGWWQAGVEVYGGPLLHTWLDRELELAGRVVTTGGSEHLVRTGPLLRIPNLAVHLDRGVNDGLKLDPQRHLQPVWGLGDLSGADVLAELAPQAVDPATIAGYDVYVADTQLPRTFGAGSSMFASARLDNLLSAHAALTALLAHVNGTKRRNGRPAPSSAAANGTNGTNGPEGGATTGTISMVAAFDHEEIGSASRSGAAGPFLGDVLARVQAALGASAEDAARSFATSLHVSSDVGHAVHPNHPERHDPANRPIAGGGPILKINANQRYTTDAHGAAAWNAACAAAGVPVQEFVSHNGIPCGSTIGPISATRLGIRTVDVGVPILSMHSARELTAVVDPWYLSRAMTAALAR
ncbi:M18 family aminopeptidase [Myceligenerans crystallogenes]|uniref:M18 family aminopeptidase n=1 Tax=Myceligenerans crystallogenes TaxID=316335 RepID=A0ABN2N222_9MICO